MDILPLVQMASTKLVNLEDMGNKAPGIGIVLRYLPFDVSLIGISQANDTMTIKGRSPDEDSIVIFLSELEDNNVFREIALSSKTSTKDGAIEFTFAVKTRE